MSSLPFELTEGDGALRLWLDWERGEPRAATADVALADVVLRLAATVEPLAFARIEGRLVATRRDDATEFAAENFSFSTADGIEWPAGRMRLTLRDGNDGGSFSADRLDLALAAGIASKLPLMPTLQEWLGTLQPRGIVSGLDTQWSGALEAPVSYSAHARIAGLSIAARDSERPRGLGRPGVANAEVELRADERGGEAKLAIAGGALHFPGMVEPREVAVQRLDAQLGWRVETRPDRAPLIDVRLTNASFANADMAGAFEARWRTGAGEGSARGGRLPGRLEVAGQLQRARAVAVARYLPLGIPQPVRRYVERAVKGGHASSVVFKAAGDLWDFPFRDRRSGEFRIAAKLHDVGFDYVPSVPAGSDEPARQSPWPGFTQLSGELVFERTSMQIRDARGWLGGFELTKASGSIDDLGNDPTLVIEGSARGPLADGLRFVNHTPVSVWTQRALSEASGGGSAELRLALKLPLDDLSRSTVNGNVTLAGNDVRIHPDTPLLGNARGRVEFWQEGFTIVNGAARVVGGDASFDGGTQRDGSLRFEGRGVASAEGLRASGEWPLLAHVARSLSGQTPYRVALGFVRGTLEMSVESELVGIDIALPAPLGKSAAVPLPMRYHSAPASGDGTRNTLRFELGEVVRAAFLRDVSRDVPVVLSGGVGIGSTMPQPPSGVHANVDVETIDIDAWQGVAAALSGSADAPSDAAGEGYMPRRIALRARELLADGRRLTKRRRRAVAGRRRMAREPRRRPVARLRRMAGHPAPAASTRGWRGSHCRKPRRNHSNRPCSTRSRRACPRSTSSSTPSNCAASRSASSRSRR